jgi:S-adenosylmethionine:tRNA ribosyltransferase-isomerase
MILNETKVIPARLIGNKKDTGGKVEVFLLNRVNEDAWEVLISPARSKKEGTKIEFGEGFGGEIVSVGNKTIFKFYCPPVILNSFQHLVERYGKVPLPPYIKREPLEIDKDRYQTVYARTPGACAAPTAGLHFTQSILQEIENKGIEVAKIVLHIGIGTFKPMKCERVEAHIMEPEYYEITEDTASKINSAKRKIAVGTTTVRALESGCETGSLVQAGKGWTNKFIYPPYKFKVVDALVTNFHLPKSTLLLLVCAFAGYNGIEATPQQGKELIFKAYKEAIANNYKFYSYGDAMLIIGTS